ncbi:MAG TPA: prepilin-type N-terminal cleavage/methylation domain-containing protein [Blastocatellia bacterium]|nr:prepilin-type N-terminal cleavage/methylation domain-containing protein [Blastocatellia bacterium]
MKAKVKTRKSKGEMAGGELIGGQEFSPAVVLHSPSGERGFSLTELMIAMMVFTLIAGSVVMLLTKSQTIFRAEQGVSEMDQNARLLMDFLTRDIQQSKENGLGLGPRFRSIYSNNALDGKTDEITIVSSDTDTKLPAGSLPLIAGSQRDFSASERFVEILPNGASRVESQEVINKIAANEEFIISGTRVDGSVQFDFIKARSAKLTSAGTIGLSFDTVDHPGVQPEIPFGETYVGGAFTIRPCTIKRYFVDRKTDKDHPAFALSINDGAAIPIARNVVAFQLRYLEVRDGEVEGQWVKQQTISGRYKTEAVEVTMTARTEIEGDKKAERLVTLASVIRPRLVPGGDFGSSPGGGGTTSPGLPGEGGGAGGGYGDGPGGGTGRGGPGGSGGPGAAGYDSNGNPAGAGVGDGSDGGSGFGDGGYKRVTKRIGKNPRLGERLNPRP